MPKVLQLQGGFGSAEKCFPKVKFVKVIGHPGKIKCTINVFAPHANQFKAYLSTVNLRNCCVYHHDRVSNKFGRDTVEERSHAAVHQLRDSLSTNVHYIILYINKFSASVQRR